jgi:hypothetical protein
MQVHSSDVEPEQLRRLLSEDIARNQAREFRRYFLTRFAVAGLLIWVFSWPVPLLPHTVLWALAAAVVFAYGLMSPPNHAATRGRRWTRRR